MTGALAEIAAEIADRHRGPTSRLTHARARRALSLKIVESSLAESSLAERQSGASTAAFSPQSLSFSRSTTMASDSLLSLTYHCVR